MSAPRFAPWEKAVHCTSGPTPGARAFMRWFVEEYGALDGYNLGIYNCRPVRGGRTTSMHGEGRASDCGFPVGDRDGDALLRRLLEIGPEKLGIQAIIYERRIYSAKSPNGAPYTGIAPHWDHLHIEFTRSAGRHLTYATIKKLMAQPVFAPGDRVLEVGDRGNDVAWVQRKLAGAFPRQRIIADGIYGQQTRTAVLRFEQAAKRGAFPGIKVDGIVGDITWRALQAAKVAA